MPAQVRRARPIEYHGGPGAALAEAAERYIDKRDAEKERDDIANAASDFRMKQAEVVKEVTAALDPSAPPESRFMPDGKPPTAEDIYGLYTEGMRRALANNPHARQHIGNPEYDKPGLTRIKEWMDGMRRPGGILPGRPAEEMGTRRGIVAPGGGAHPPQFGETEIAGPGRPGSAPVQLPDERAFSPEVGGGLLRTGGVEQEPADWKWGGTAKGKAVMYRPTTGEIRMIDLGSAAGKGGAGRVYGWSQTDDGEVDSDKGFFPNPENLSALLGDNPQAAARAGANIIDGLLGAEKFRTEFGKVREKQAETGNFLATIQGMLEILSIRQI